MSVHPKWLQQRAERDLIAHFASDSPAVWPLRGPSCLCVPIRGCRAWQGSQSSTDGWGHLTARWGTPRIAMSGEHSMQLAGVTESLKIWDIIDNVTPLYLQMSEPESFKTLFPAKDLTSVEIRKLWCHRRMWCVRTNDNNGRYLGLSWTTVCDNYHFFLWIP